MISKLSANVDSAVSDLALAESLDPA
jgi:hypothetical protein